MYRTKSSIFTIYMLYATHSAIEVKIYIIYTQYNVCAYLCVCVISVLGSGTWPVLLVGGRVFQTALSLNPRNNLSDKLTSPYVFFTEK